MKKTKKNRGSLIDHVRKHAKLYMIGGAVLIVLGIGMYYIRQNSLSKAVSGQLEDLPRQEEVVVNDFYSSQFTKDEYENLEYLKERMENLQGGVVTLPHPVNGKEYMRLTTALESEGYNYFYGCYEVPMTEDNVYVMHKERDYEKITERKIAKLILFLSCAEGLDLSGDYAEDGTVRNLEKIDEKLKVNIPEKVEKIKEEQQQTDAILDEVIENIPEGAGEKSTLDYFIRWMDENIKFHTEIQGAANSATNMGEMLDHIYKYNHLVIVKEKKGIPLGYAKVLAELCNRAGMEAHIVMGKWKAGLMSSDNYVFTAVHMNDQMIYVDASGAKANNMGGERYLREIEAMNHMEPMSYFEYKS